MLRLIGTSQRMAASTYDITLSSDALRETITGLRDHIQRLAIEEDAGDEDDEAEMNFLGPGERPPHPPVGGLAAIVRRGMGLRGAQQPPLPLAAPEPAARAVLPRFFPPRAAAQRQDVPKKPSPPRKRRKVMNDSSDEEEEGEDEEEEPTRLLSIEEDEEGAEDGAPREPEAEDEDQDEDM